jgi:hypothetical protein
LPGKLNFRDLPTNSARFAPFDDFVKSFVKLLRPETPAHRFLLRKGSERILVSESLGILFAFGLSSPDWTGSEKRSKNILKNPLQSFLALIF